MHGDHMHLVNNLAGLHNEGLQMEAATGSLNTLSAMAFVGAASSVIERER